MRLWSVSMDYVVDLPKRFNFLDSSVVKIIRYCGEYVYVPRKHTFLRSRILSEEEVRAIADKLKELNKGKVRK